MKIPRVLVAILILVAPLYGQSRSRRSNPVTGNPEEPLVPWTYIEKSGALAKQPLDLYWIPASMKDVETSPLSASNVLLEDSSLCLGLAIVVPDDAATIAKLGATGKLPIAVLADREGKVIRTVDNVRGALHVTAVERMVSDELNARGEAMYRDITQAKRFAMSGETQRAIELYKKVWDDRCLFPTFGTEAQRALKDLGVIVKEPPAPVATDPYLQPKKSTNPKPPNGR